MGVRDGSQVMNITQVPCPSVSSPRGSRPRRATVAPWLLSGAIVAALGACQPAQSASQPTVSLRLHGTPAGATVIIDEEALGTLDFVAAHGVALPPGLHHVTVKATGYFPSDVAVDAQAGSAPVVVGVALVPVPD